jgi:hypothetical protein
VTSSFSPSQPVRRGPAPVNAVIVGLIGGFSVLMLFVLGVTFVGLAIAFPIAVPIAEAYHLPVKAADAALALQLAGFWWAFAALALATFAAAGVIVVKLIDFLSPAPRD